MKVILSEDIQSLGRIGDVVSVKEGYARNFLFPHRKAYLATDSNLKKIEIQKRKRTEIEAASRKEAEEIAEKLKKVSCTVASEVNDLDKLYGSITEAEIAKALEVEGFDIDRKDILLEAPITELGIFEVGVKLHRDVVAKIRLWVTKK